MKVPRHGAIRRSALDDRHVYGPRPHAMGAMGPGHGHAVPWAGPKETHRVNTSSLQFNVGSGILLYRGFSLRKGRRPYFFLRCQETSGVLLL